MVFVTGRGRRAHRFADKSRTTNDGYPRYGGIGWAMARMPWHGNGAWVQFPHALGHRYTGRATCFVGESDAKRVADVIDNFPAHRTEGPHTGAVPTGAPGATAPSTDDVRPAPPVPDGAAPVLETWRRRIAEEFVHQEGVSL